MKKLILSLFLLVTALQVGAQVPVTVSKTITPNGSEIVVEFEAEIAPGYYMYSTDIPQGGPKPTYLKFSELKGAELVGVLAPVEEPMVKYESVFNMQVKYFEEFAAFTQTLKITDENFEIDGTLHYQSCGVMGCVPGRYDFKITKDDVDVTIVPAEAVVDGAGKDSEGESDSSDSSIWVTFALGFGGGLLALLTPCVWPIIPMTVSFFLKRSKGRKQAIREALIYGASIVVIYLLLGLAVTLIFGPAALNELATNAFFNVFFFLMLLVFGASFLGGFEIKLPSSWTNKVDAKASSTTGILSIFLMAFTLALVSFSCTGPIIGFLLVEAATSGDLFGPAVGMFGFALSLALPFTLFAIFPSLLKQTPRSGGWMNTIKVVLGFVEIAFALKFLSVADLTKGWGILDRETFLALWIALFTLLGLYLLKIIRMPHDDPSDKTTSVSGFFAALVSLAFAMYMVPGLWGAPCKAVSAFAPPMRTQDFNLHDQSFEPHTHDYDEALRMSREQNKPIFVDFTGHGCVNCREMEAAVLTQGYVLKELNDKFIVVSLYVDDRTELPEPFIGEDGNKYTEVGEKWSYLQEQKFGALSQPFYVVVDSDGQQLGGSFAYNTNVGEFMEFLKKGLNEFNKKAE
ncbi:MAG: thioredoxin family protein [Bacteroidaceae bacterium]|nr:thioredoxin family protein [Bacteroidaceae bacterium]